MTILTFRDYEYEVLKLERKDFNSATKLMKNATGLAEEAGEALSHVRKHQYNGKDLDLEKMKKELGDVLWYVVATANVLGMSFREIAEANVEKLQKRYPKGEYSHEACVAQADEKPAALHPNCIESGSLSSSPDARPNDAPAARPVRVGDKIRYRGWNKMEWPSGHEVTAVHDGGFSRQLDKGTIDVRREHVPDWKHADGAPIAIAETFAAFAPRSNDAPVDFASRHVMCSQGPDSRTGVRTIYKHDSKCEHQDENVEPEAERGPRIPRQDTARDMWLLTTPPHGEVKVPAERYKELRALANKLAKRADARVDYAPSTLIDALRRVKAWQETYADLFPTDFVWSELDAILSDFDLRSAKSGV